MLLHKRKDGGAQWIYRYTLHGRRREMGLGALRDVSLKQARECANQWRSVLGEGRAALKECNKQKCEVISTLHYLKDIALDSFESRKEELKGDGKNGDWFLPLRLHIFPKLGCLSVLEITQTGYAILLLLSGIQKQEQQKKYLSTLIFVSKRTMIAARTAIFITNYNIIAHEIPYSSSYNPILIVS